jgi:hypothetical protein
MPKITIKSNFRTIYTWLHPIFKSLRPPPLLDIEYKGRHKHFLRVDACTLSYCCNKIKTFTFSSHFQHIYKLFFSVSAPPKTIRIDPFISETDTRYLNVSCQVQGVYPVPLIDISWTKKYVSSYMKCKYL